MAFPAFAQMLASGSKRALLRLGVCSFLASLDVVDPAAAAAAGLHAATASTVAVQTLLEADLIGAGKTALASCPRQVSVTTAGVTASDAPATAVLSGWTVDGTYVSETLTIAQTATSVNSTYFYSKIEKLVYAAGDGAGATLAVGFTAPLGLPVKAKGRGASSAVFAIVSEHVDGAVPTAGALTSPLTAKPFGSYTPNSAPNAARDYLVRYECDPMNGHI